jgi:hypothetical protein
MTELDEFISDIFNKYWCGEHVLSSLENMKAQLHKNLTDQLNGYWSGHSAYMIMVKGGFLLDADRKATKELTMLGEKFMKDFTPQVKG